jgi:hypothetical protein
MQLSLVVLMAFLSSLVFVYALWHTVFVKKDVHNIIQRLKNKMAADQRSSVAVPPTLPFPTLFLAEKTR